MPGKSAEHAPRVVQPTTAVQLVPGVPHVNVYNLPSPEPALGQYLTAAGLFVSLAIAVGNAVWQSYLQRRQAQNSLFEKRFSVYLRVREFLSASAIGQQPQLPQLQQLLRDTNSAEWLFKPLINDFIEELYAKGQQLRQLNDLQARYPRILAKFAAIEMLMKEGVYENVFPQVEVHT